MRITVMGSSPAWPNPGGAQSGYLVEGAGKLLLDCGPGVLGRLREAGPVDVDAIAITHFHLDHWGDLVPWAWLAAYGPDGATRPELWLPPDGTGELDAFTRLWGNDRMFQGAFAIREFEPRAPFRAAGFELEAWPVPHFGLAAFGFRVREPATNAMLAYSGDSAPGPPLVELARGADLFICEATLAETAVEREPRGHLAAGEALAAADGPILLTHRPIELPPPNGVALAHDGMTVEVEGGEEARDVSTP